MTKHYATFEHTADIGIEAAGDTLGELYEGLAEGLADFICDRRQAEPREMRVLNVQAEDAEALAVDFLSAVMNLVQTSRFMVHSVTATQACEYCVEAQIAGEPYDPQRHELHTEVKAVTYHQLKVERQGDQWIGRVILDL